MTTSRILMAVAVAATFSQAQSWQRVQGIDSTRGVYSTAVLGGVFFAATDTLVYRSVDGLAWQQTAAQPSSSESAYPFLQAHATGLYAGLNEGGVRRSTNGGQTWTVAGSSLPNEDVLAVAVLGDSLYAGLGFSGVYVLNLASPGAWTPYNTGLTQFGTNWIGTAGGRLFAGLGYGLFSRARGGSQWIEGTLGAGLQRQFYEVAASGAHYFAASNTGVYRADVSNVSAWQLVEIAGMSGRHVSAVTTQGSRVFANVSYSGQHWIWSTDNAGASWEVRAHEYAEAYEMRFIGDRMWTARADGLWYYDFAPVALKPARPARRAPAAGLLPARRVDGRLVRTAPASVQKGFSEITLPVSP